MEVTGTFVPRTPWRADDALPAADLRIRRRARSHAGRAGGGHGRVQRVHRAHPLEERLPGWEALEPTATATTVRVRDGRTLTTDGPFAETKEALGGYYLVEAKDLDEAIDFAARIPGAQTGSIEVRPIWEIPAEYLAGAEAAAAN